jgi:rfaE bifunctional protein nucleotidyltransferase chain/domain
METEYKIQNRTDARNIVEKWQDSGLNIVFTNGCFDIVHLGHVDYWQKARNLGDKLVVGLNTDASVSRIKGPNRPICLEISRARVMAAFQFVDLVVLFDEPTPLELIQLLKPDILTKGADYTLDNIVGADFVIQHGGEVKTIAFVDGFSTSSIISKIKNT